MWNKIKIIGLTFALVAVAVAGIVFGRSTNRGRISDNNDLSGDIADGIDSSTERNNEAQESVGRIENGISEAKLSADRAGSRIGNAQDQLRTAIEILRNAKKKG